MRLEGKLTSWIDEKGFGFITPESGGKQVFVHIKSFKHRRRRPELNQVVTYVLTTDKQGRTCAVKVMLAGDTPPGKARRGKGFLAIITVLFFFAIVGVSVLAGRIPPQVLALYLVASLLTYIAYYFDKSAAQKGAWRTQESTLHFMSLVGGWPGALIAQQTLRHKSRKQSFRTVFWLTVVVNCIAFAWFFTTEGRATFQSYVAPVIYS